MLLVIPAILACVIALLRGGSLRRLSELHVRASALILGSFLIQVVVYLPALRTSTVVVKGAEPIYIAALTLAVIGMLSNWRLGPALQIAALGLFLNMLVILLNTGHMPVNASAMRSVQGQAKVSELKDPHIYGNTRLANSSSRLLLFSDIIPVPIPGDHGNVYSIGDVLISAGVMTLVYRATRRGYGEVGARDTGMLAGAS
jgi:uncharacterized membrane protein YfhO